jgi:hypothetical protein
LLNAKGECPAEIHKQIFAVYGNIMNRQIVTKWAVNSPKEGLIFTTNKEAVGHLWSLTTVFRKLKENTRKSTRDCKRVASHHSRSVYNHNSCSCDRKIRVQKIVPTLGAQNVIGRSHNETDGFRAEVSHALPTGRRWVSARHCDGRWNMRFSPHFRWTFAFCVEKSYDGRHLAFGGSLDRRCHFKYVSLKQCRFYHCQASTAHR